MQIVFRRYRVRLGALDVVARQAKTTLVPLLRQVPGFGGYYLANAGDGTVASIGLFDTPEAAAAGDSVAEQWFRDDWPAFQAVPPAGVSGEVLVAEEVHRERRVEIAGIPRLERRSGSERRHRDRRIVRDRRAAEVVMPAHSAT